MSLIKKMKYCGEVDSLKYSYVKIVHSLLNISNLIKIELCDNFKNSCFRSDSEGKYKWVDPSLDEIKENFSKYWCTFEGYSKCRLKYINDESVEITLNIFDKILENIFIQHTHRIRVSYVLSITVSELELFSDMIECDFNGKLEDEYDDYLENQKRRWINKRANNITND